MLGGEAHLPVEAGGRWVIHHRMRVGGQQVTTWLQRGGDLARESVESEAVADIVEHLAAHDQLEGSWNRVPAHVELLEADMAKGAAAFTRPFDRGGGNVGRK